MCGPTTCPGDQGGTTWIVARITLTDGPGGQPETYSDDSFGDVHDAYAPVVVARLPSGIDLRWHQDVVQRLARRSRELKAAVLLNHWGELPLDLQRAIMRTIREACISILDARTYIFEFDRLVVRTVRGIRDEALGRVRERFLAGYVTDRVLWSSPAARIKRMLFPEDPFGLALSGFYGLSSQRPDDDSLFESLRSKLQKPHNLRLYGARSAATFAELQDTPLSGNARSTS